MPAITEILGVIGVRTTPALRVIRQRAAVIRQRLVAIRQSLGVIRQRLVTIRQSLGVIRVLEVRAVRAERKPRGCDWDKGGWTCRDLTRLGHGCKEGGDDLERRV